MKIERGYDNKPTKIMIRSRTEDKEFNRTAEVWIEQEGVRLWLLGKTLKAAKKGKKYEDYEVVQDQAGNRFVQGEIISEIKGHETLAYVSLDELLALRDECNDAIQELVK